MGKSIDEAIAWAEERARRLYAGVTTPPGVQLPVVLGIAALRRRINPVGAKCDTLWAQSQ